MEDMKKTYIKPEIQVIEIDNFCILCCSEPSTISLTFGEETPQFSGGTELDKEWGDMWD